MGTKHCYFAFILWNRPDNILRAVIVIYPKKMCIALFILYSLPGGIQNSNSCPNHSDFDAYQIIFFILTSFFKKKNEFSSLGKQCFPGVHAENATASAFFVIDKMVQISFCFFINQKHRT